jgi:hypothetical protein
MYTINFWPILVASAVSFGLSSLWYSPILFGKEWMDLLKITDRNVSEMSAGTIWLRYVIQFIITIVSFCVLAFVIAMAGVNSGSDGAFMGFLTWLGFMLPVSLSGLLWKKEPLKLVLIDVINNLVILAIGGAIIGAWR